MVNLLEKAIIEMEHAKAFISSSQKMNKTQIGIYDKVLSEIKEAYALDKQIDIVKSMLDEYFSEESIEELELKNFSLDVDPDTYESLFKKLVEEKNNITLKNK